MPLAFFAWFCLKSTLPRPCLLKIPLKMMWNIKDHLYHSSALGPLWLHQPLVTILSTELGEAPRHPRDKMESCMELPKKRQKISKYESQILHAARAKWRAKCIKIYGEYCIGVCLLSTPCFASYFHPRTWYLPLSSKEIGETQHVGSDGTVGRTVIWNRKSKKSTDSHWGGWYSHIQSIPGWWLMPACRSHLGKSQDRFSWLRILLFHLAMSFIIYIYIYMRACMQTLHYVGLRGLARSTSLHVCFACLQCQRFACVNWFWLHRAVACTRPTLSLPTARGKYCLRSSRCACQAFRPYACMFACICCYLF